MQVDSKFSQLPQDIIDEVCYFLTIKDVLNLTETNKEISTKTKNSNYLKNYLLTKKNV